MGWQLFNTSYPAWGSSPSLVLESTVNPDLSLGLRDQVGGPRLVLWPKGEPIPLIGHTGIPATFAFHGDGWLGDWGAIGRNPMTYAYRCEVGLPASAVTQYFSAKYGAADVDGGAMIVTAPTDAAADDDGYVMISPHGLGPGRLAGAVVFSRRTGVDTNTPWLVFNKDGHIEPVNDGVNDIGLPGYRFRTVRAVASRMMGMADEAGFTHAQNKALSGITTWSTVGTIAPSGTAGSYGCGSVEVSVYGSTGGVGNGLRKSCWKIDIADGPPTVAAVGSEVTDGYAPGFRLLVSGSDVLMQVQSHDATGAFGGNIRFIADLPKLEGTFRTWSVTA